MSFIYLLIYWIYEYPWAENTFYMFKEATDCQKHHLWGAQEGIHGWTVSPSEQGTVFKTRPMGENEIFQERESKPKSGRMKWP